MNQDALLNLTRAIALQEGGGKPDFTSGLPNGTPAGGDGEQGAWQWLPGTFQKDAQSVGLNGNDWSAANQQKVAYKMISNYYNQRVAAGSKTAAQDTASWWNSGQPDEWQPGTKQKTGNTPQYVQNVSNYYKQLSGAQNTSNQTAGLPTLSPAASVTSNNNATAGLPNLPQARNSQNQTIDTTVPVTPPAPQPKKDFLQKLTNTLTTIFPGSATVGDYFGTKIAQLEGTPKESAIIQQNEPAPSAGKTALAGGELALEAVSPMLGGLGSGLGGIGGVAARAGIQGGIGAALGGLNAAVHGQNVGSGALAGGATGAGLGLVGEGISALTKALPKWIIGKYTQKLPEELEDKLVNNAPVGTVSKVLSRATTSMNRVGQQISDAISDVKNDGKFIDNFDIGQKTFQGNPNIPRSGLPNSEPSMKLFKNTLKKLVGDSDAALVNKLFPKEGGLGTLTMKESHDLWSDLGSSIGKKFADDQNISNVKKIGKQIYFAMRQAMVEKDPSLDPLFTEYSKNRQIVNALSKIKTRTGFNIGLKDLFSMIAGGGLGAGEATLSGNKKGNGALKGALLGLALEKGITNPDTEMFMSTLLNKAGKTFINNPVAQAIAQQGRNAITANAKNIYNASSR